MIYLFSKGGKNQFSIVLRKAPVIIIRLGLEKCGGFVIFLKALRFASPVIQNLKTIPFFFLHKDSKLKNDKSFKGSF